MRTLLLAFTVLSVACQEDPGGFGDPKKQGHSDQPMDKTEKPPAPPPDFGKALQLQPAFDKATGQLTVVMKLAPGFHAYAPGEAIGKPVELAVGPDNGWMVDGAPVVPAGKTKDLGELGKSMILEGDVPLTATVKGGQGPIVGAVKAQVCTDSACDRPKTHAFSVPVT
jgi:hypothetical protein